MILTGVEVQGVRCLIDPVKVVFAPDRLNVMAGPNGAGKSTFLEAVRRCLLDSHTSSAATDLVPWSDARTPEIAVEFEHGGRVYRLTKRFVKRKSTTFEQKTGERWSVLHEGKEADDAVRAMLLSGGRNDEGIFSVLWAPQNGLAVGDLSKPVVAHLREGLGAQLGHLSLEKKIHKLWEDNFQRSTGLPRKGRLHEIDAELQRVQTTAENAGAALEEADALGRAASDMRKRLEETDLRICEREPQLALAEITAAKAQELSAVLERLAGECKLIDTQLQSEKQKLVDIDAESRRHNELAADVPVLEAKHNRALDEESFAVTKEVEALDRLRALDVPDPEEERLKKVVPLAERRQKLHETLQHVDQQNARERQVLDELGAMPAPDRTTLEEIRKRTDELQTALVWLQKLELQIEVAAESTISVEVSGGTPQGSTELPATADFLIRGNDGLTMRIPGIVALRVTGSETDTAEWRRREFEAREGLRILCEGFGTQDVEILAQRYEQRSRLEGELLRVRDHRAQALKGTSEEQLRTELDSLERDLRVLGVSDHDLEALRLDLVEVEQRSKQRRREAEAAWRSAFEAKGQKQGASRDAASALEWNRVQRLASLERLRALRSDGKSDEQRQRDADELARRLNEAESRHANAEDEGAMLPPDAEAVFETLRAEQGADLELRMKLLTGIAEAEAAQRTLLAHGPYTTLAEAEEEVARLNRERDAEQKRLDGIKRLWITYDEEKTAALNGVAEPVARRATELLREFAGSHLATLSLSDSLSSVTISPPDAARAAELDELSGGEQELVQIAVRLALAENVSRTERQAVVLDDVLLNTDDARLSRILQYLERNRERLQVIVLTCHPERYAALDGAFRVEFPQPTAARAAGA